jgi:hypothetical protein
LVTRQGGKIWAKNAPGQGAVFSVTLPIFSLSNLIAPALSRNGHGEDPITLVVTEIGSRIGWLSEEVRAEISTPVRNLLERCLYSDLDVLLPKTCFAGAAELFFIVAITDALGGEAITKRIQKQLDSCKHIKQADLIISTSYQLLEPTERNTSESLADFLEKVAAKIQERINQEISSRVVEHG